MGHLQCIWVQSSVPLKKAHDRKYSLDLRLSFHFYEHQTSSHHLVILCTGMTNAAGEIIFVAFGAAVTDECAAAVSRVASEKTMILDSIADCSMWKQLLRN